MKLDEEIKRLSDKFPEMRAEKMRHAEDAGWEETFTELEDWTAQIVEWLKELNEYRNRGLCKDCKHFEYDSVAMVDGNPLIVAHEICKKWGDGCKTKEDGYCFMFEEKEE